MPALEFDFELDVLFQSLLQYFGVEQPWSIILRSITLQLASPESLVASFQLTPVSFNGVSKEGFPVLKFHEVIVE